MFCAKGLLVLKLKISVRVRKKTPLAAVTIATVLYISILEKASWLALATCI